jgi:CubicO group peptidase (beta-lactamase class C family)
MCCCEKAMKKSIEKWKYGQRQLLLVLACLWVLITVGIYGCKETEPDPEPLSLTELFAQKMEDTLRNRGVGYAFTIYEGTQLVASGSGGFQSRAADPEGQKEFTIDTKLHIASMTKTLTAMAFLKAAALKGVKTTDVIAPYLPSSWKLGAGMGKVTFGDLLTHKSGIKGLNGTCQNGSYSENIYDGLRKLVALGVSSRGEYCYQNANFGLFRILIPRMMGYGFTGNDATDDAQTQQRYLAFLQQEIFVKADVQNAVTTFPVNNPTYTYNFPVTVAQRGWNPGGFNAVLGGYGMYLTATEAGKIYGSALSSSKNEVLPAALADSLIVKNLGCYKATSNLGTIVYHDGWWYESLQPAGRGLRTLWVKFPNNITCVLLVNALQYRGGSLVFPFNDGNILGFVYNAYVKALQGRGARVSAEAGPLFVEHPEPH